MSLIQILPIKQSIKIFIINCKEYEDFFVITSLSILLGKYKFVLKKSILDLNIEIITGLIYSIEFSESAEDIVVFGFHSLGNFDIEKLNHKRLFAVQSLSSLIDKIIHNVDDIYEVINLIPKIYLIFSRERWFNIYLYLEFKLLLIYDRHNMVKLYNKNLQINHDAGDKLLDFKSLANGEEKDKLNFLGKIWLNIENGFPLPKERVVFSKLFE